MKNMFKLLKKSFIGIPVAIFIYELLNLTISIMANKYLKMDEFNLQQLIYDYIEFGFIGYAYAFVMNYMEYNIKNSDKNEIQRTRNVVNLLGSVLLVVILVCSILENDIIFGFIMIAMVSILVLIILFIIYLFDKNNIKDINKKIKENNNK